MNSCIKIIRNLFKGFTGRGSTESVTIKGNCPGFTCPWRPIQFYLCSWCGCHHLYRGIFTIPGVRVEGLLTVVSSRDLRNNIYYHFIPVSRCASQYNIICIFYRFIISKLALEIKTDFKLIASGRSCSKWSDYKSFGLRIIPIDYRSLSYGSTGRDCNLFSDQFYRVRICCMTLK